MLVQVETAEVYTERIEGLWPSVRDRLRDLRDQVGTVRRLDGPPDELHVRLGQPAGMDAAVQAVAAAAQPVFSITGGASREFEVRAEGDTLVVTLTQAEKAAIDARTMQQSLEIIRRRVDETGTREPSIQRQGADRILVQVPGIGSAEELLEVIGQTARLSFHPVVSRSTDPNAQAGLDELVLPSMDEPGAYYIVERRAVVTGEQLVDSQPSFDQNGRPAVTFRFNPSGGAAFGAYTGREHRQALRHRARQRGDLGAGDPGAHLRRVGHHHRQLHPRGILAAVDPAARRRAAGGDHRARAAHRRAGARRRLDPLGHRRDDRGLRRRSSASWCWSTASSA